MKSITTLHIQYSHRFLNYEGEAQYLHGHTGKLIIEVKGKVNEKTGFVWACNDIKKIAWKYLQNFDHALILQEEDPILPHIWEIYEKQGIKNGCETNRNIGAKFKNELTQAYPEARLVTVKKVATCENLIEDFYSLLKEELNIKRLTFYSGDNAASSTF